jgi:Transposase DDE domain
MEKKEYRISNWSEYNQSLQNRGSISLFIEPGILERWNEPKIPGKNGRPKEYSNDAILCILQIRLAYNLSLRQAQGFVKSIFEIAGIKQKVPHYSLLSLRQHEIKLPKLQTKENNNKKAIDMVIDSTGIKVYGEGEWKVRTHGISKHRTWRKIHLAIDPETHEILAEEMTENDAGDPEELPELLDQVSIPINRVIADGAYDTKKCYEAIEKKRSTSSYSSARECTFVA